MLTPKENKKIIDDYDYLANAASSGDCTGLIPSLPTSDTELVLSGRLPVPSFLFASVARRQW